MAKGQVFEEELAKGLKGIGNFGGLAPSRVQRDNPFRDSRSESSAPEQIKTIEVLPASAPSRVSDHGSVPTPRIAPKPANRPKPQSAPKPASKERGERKRESASVRKLDIFTERVTLQISPEMRDEVERIAREIQRTKTSKAECITANTVMRVAILLRCAACCPCVVAILPKAGRMSTENSRRNNSDDLLQPGGLYKIAPGQE